MPGCHHNHKVADKWTNLGTIAEGAVSAVSNFYWGMSLANLIDSNAEDDDMLSTASITVGLAFSILAIGSMYTHQKLNTFHQPDTTTADHTHHQPSECHHEPTRSINDSPPPLLHEHSLAREHTHEIAIPASNDLENPLLNVSQQIDKSHPTESKLSRWQKVALASDLFTHTGDVSGGLALGVDLMTQRVIGVKVPYVAKVLTRCSLTLFGMAASVANVRSCKDAITKQNEQQESHVHTRASTI